MPTPQLPKDVEERFDKLTKYFADDNWWQPIKQFLAEEISKAIMRSIAETRKHSYMSDEDLVKVIEAKL